MGNSGCNVCPDTRRLSYLALDSDDDTIGEEAWLEERLSNADKSVRNMIKDEALGQLLAKKHGKTHYLPPNLECPRSPDTWQNRRTSRDVHGITSTDEQPMGASSPIDELFERRVTISSMDESLQKIPDLSDCSQSPPMARDFIYQAVKLDRDANNNSQVLGCKNLILNYADGPHTTRSEKESTPEFYDSVLDKYGFDDSDSDENGIFQETNANRRTRSCITIDEMRSSRDRLLQEQDQYEGGSPTPTGPVRRESKMLISGEDLLNARSMDL